MHLNENQIALDAQEIAFRPGVQSTDHPLIVTITPERLARSIELDASTAFRDAFALAWAATGIPDVGVPAHLADLETEVRNLRAELSSVERLRTNERALLCEEIAARQNAEGEAAQMRRQRDEFKIMVQRQVDRDGVFAETLSRVVAERRAK